MPKMLGRKTKLTQHGITDEMSPRYTKEMDRQESKAEIEDQIVQSDFDWGSVKARGLNFQDDETE